mmetsp:Transcript_23083/g.75252  ORF Transcript_23083/g.75252 Transcript_23083/m.75252 type:complete len:80 (+) Transcript_23083:310-549(+)
MELKRRVRSALEAAKCVKRPLAVQAYVCATLAAHLLAIVLGLIRGSWPWVVLFAFTMGNSHGCCHILGHVRRHRSSSLL